jgi:SAM-dependent MidA family methyltransferase
LAPRLSAKLAKMAAGHPTGTLGVDDYMETALYDPEGGFYVRAEGVGGPRRAFATIPSLSPLLGRAILAWARALEGRGPLDVVEVGAGGGHLAAAFLDAAGWWGRRSLRYHIVEISPRLREVQAGLLAGRQVVWHDSLKDAVDASEQATGRTAIISNELVDAFPCKLLRYEKGDWRELRLAWPPAGEASLTAHDTDLDLGPFTACDPLMWPGGIPEGQVVEIQPAFRDWLQEWAPAGRPLDVLTIDYGDPVADLYRDRPRGTLRGYVAHQRLTGAALFRGPGTIDLTCDVNFTDLQAWGQSQGLRTVELVDQAGFLARWLPAKEQARHRDDLARITDPDGAGAAFKVLWQTGS